MNKEFSTNSSSNPNLTSLEQLRFRKLEEEARRCQFIIDTAREELVIKKAKNNLAIINQQIEELKGRVK